MSMTEVYMSELRERFDKMDKLFIKSRYVPDNELRALIQELHVIFDPAAYIHYENNKPKQTNLDGF